MTTDTLSGWSSSVTAVSGPPVAAGAVTPYLSAGIYIGFHNAPNVRDLGGWSTNVGRMNIFGALSVSGFVGDNGIKGMGVSYGFYSKGVIYGSGGRYFTETLYTTNW